MANKKYTFILGLISLLASSAFAQTGSGYSVFDSSVIPAKRLPQQNEFMNNAYNFPAKPRNMVEIGASIGSLAIAGDLAARIPQLGFEVHARKALGYVVSLRVQYLNGVAKGLNWKPANGYTKNPAWVSTARGGSLTAAQNYTGPVFYNYRTHIQDLSIQGIVNLNNVRFHKDKSKLALYTGAGIGMSWYHAKINSLDANGNNYATLFNNVASSQNIAYSNRREILKQLRNGMDNTYETEGEADKNNHGTLGNNILLPSFTFIIGAAYKLSDRINIALEDRHTFVPTQLLDGQRWQEQTINDPVRQSNNDSYNYLSLGLNYNLGSKAKNVQPLWWLNPLDYAYSEINNPKHMKQRKPVLDDTDSDGVTDQFDKEPNTPAGSPVDSHGVSRDTDGDGVPDYKDKQLITPTECQPVDADGVGKCPPPPCCAALLDTINNRTISNCASDYPSLSIKAVSLTADSKALLASVASKLKNKPNCSITITAYPTASKAQQSLADKKLNAVKNYLVETLGISADRVSVDKVIDGGDANTIDIKSN